MWGKKQIIGIGLLCLGSIFILFGQEEVVVNQDEVTPRSFQRQPQATEVVAKTDEARAFDQQMRAKGFNGTLLMVQAGKVTLNQGYGYANLAKQTPNRSRETLPIASITKNLTAIMVMQELQKRGGSVDDKIGKYLPDLPGGDQTTIKALLTMNGQYKIDGPSYAPKEYHANYNQYYRANLYKRPLPPAGTPWQYNSHNYQVLELFLEKMTGQSFDRRLKMRFGKYDVMTYNRFSHQVDQPTGWVDDKPGVYDANIFDREQGTGNVFATNLALYQILRDEMNGTLLEAKAFQAMTTPKEGQTYSGGMYTARDLGGYKLHGMFTAEGFEPGVFISQDGQQAVVALSNQMPAQPPRPLMGDLKTAFIAIQAKAGQLPTK